MSEKIICWRGCDGDIQPVKCICEDKFGYPNYCTPENTDRSERMYENTHFLEISDAWKSIIRSFEAGISIYGRDLVRAQQNLVVAEKAAANELANYCRVMDNPENPFRKAT